MPEGALYWYGNECDSVTGGYDSVGYDIAGLTISAGTKLSSYLYFAKESNRITFLGSNNSFDLTSFTKAKLFNENNITGTGRGLIWNFATEKNYSSVVATWQALTSGSEIAEVDISTINKNVFVELYRDNTYNANAKVYALWLE